MSSEQNSRSSFPPEIEQLQPYSMCGTQVLKKLYILAQDIVDRKIPGDVVECGVCNGGSAAAISLALGKTSRKIWLYDSFMGLPETTETDGEFATTYVGACVGTPEKVKDAMAIAGVCEQDYIIQEGWFKDTFQKPLPKSISLLHIDADWYDSVMLSLNTFYELVSEGGTIILDDFAHWEGCREAFYDFAARRNIKPLLERFGYTQAFWVKGRTHNREFVGRWEIP